MATGKPPFIELGSPEAAMFKVGFYKQHPQIPEELSEKAKSFIKRCFDADPSKRATASELLEDPFLNEKKKTSRGAPMAPQDFSRSISVPAEKINKNYQPTNSASNSFSTTIPRTITIDETHNHTHPAKPKGPSLLAPIVIPRGVSMTSIVTPETEDPPTNSRRSSLMSPEVVEGAPRHPLENDGFFLLKKDSQRRKTLSEVLTEDKATIRAVWEGRIRSEISDPLLKTQHLDFLVDVLRDYITAQDKDNMETSLNKVKDEFSSNMIAIDHLQLALYSFHDAVTNVLKSRKIKPHWMFALDTLIRTAVQAAVSILSPEQNEGQERYSQGQTDGTPSVNSTVNSHQTSISSSYQPNFKPRIRTQLNSLKNENYKLMQEMVEVQRTLQGFLRQMVDEYKSLLECTRGVLPCHSSTTYGSAHDCSSFDSELRQNDSKTRIVPQISITDSGDKKLVNWLESQNIDDAAINKFIAEDYTFSDVLQSMSRDDLRRLNLKGGVELRLWNSILSWRKENKPAPTPNKKPTFERSRFNSYENSNHTHI